MLRNCSIPQQAIIVLLFIANSTWVVAQSSEFTNTVLELPFGAAVRQADFNGDSYEDFIVSGRMWDGSNAVAITRVYQNNGNGTFSFHGQELFGFAKARIACGDFDYDDDNDIDFIISGYYYDESGSLTTLSLLYRNDGDFQFTSVNNGIFPNDYDGVYDWGDYDSDGDLDIFYIGKGSTEAKIFKNNNGSFSEIETSIGRLIRGDAKWGDYDNDGDMDILVNGEDSIHNRVTRIYKNVNNEFNRLNVDFLGVSNSNVDWGDYDSDGDLDFLSTGRYTSSIYLNEGNDLFTLISTQNLKGLNHGIAKWGDYDLDGDLDILVCGDWGYSEDYMFVVVDITAVFENVGNNIFEQHDIPASNLEGIDWIDYDNDGDLDVLVTGTYNTKLIENSHANQSNNPPSTPSNLRAEQRGTSLVLKWDPSSDDVSSDATIQYNVRIGNNSHWDYLIAPSANPYLGFPRVRGHGNALFTNEKVIHNVSPEEYYWGVQAIDNSGLASVFNDAGGYVIMKPLFSQAYVDTSFSYSESHVCWGDYNNDGYMDAFSNGKVFTNQEGSISYSHNLSNLEYIYYAEWVDYDNDGDLDIAFCGYTTAGPSYIFGGEFNVFINQNNSFYLDTDIQVEGVAQGNFSWKDFNSDGLKDLVISGLYHSVGETQRGRTKFYLNSHDAGLTETTFPIQPDEFGYCYSEDLDSDQDIDIIFRDYWNKYGRTLINDGNGNFMIVDKGVPCIRGDYIFGDYDNDKDIDILIGGTDSIFNKRTMILRNTNDNFNNAFADLPGLLGPSTNWLDMDGDHDLDVLLAGRDNAFRVYHAKNVGDDDYAIEIITDIPVTYCEIETGDYDNDGDPDFLISGNINGTASVAVYQNNNFEKSLHPNPPENPKSELDGFDVVFSWDDPFDDSGVPIGYSYDIKVGTSPGLCDIVAPDSDPVTGFIRTMHMGNASVNNSWRLKDLPLGTYYWSVLAINQSYQSSTWAPLGSFTIAQVSPDFDFNTVCYGSNTKFTDLSVTSDVISGWKWEFGDGSISTSRNPSHPFNSAGVHNVTLWAYTQSGDSASVTKEVLVLESPNTQYTAPAVCDREGMVFTDQSTTGNLSGISYLWEFGDGETSAIQSSITHLYSAPGSYTTSLTISANNGCSKQFLQEVTVAEYPEAQISLEPGYSNNFCSDDSTILVIPHNAGYNYQWQINDVNIFDATGNSITVKGPSGEYSVQVENPASGCVSSDSVQITVRSAPASPEIIRTGPSVICEGDSVLLDVTDSPGVICQWLLNGGEIGIDANIYYARASGEYTCKLSNEYGCTTTSSNVVSISVTPGPATPVLKLSGPTMFCEGQTLTLSISDPGSDDYQWINENGPMSGESGSVLTIETTGFYKVRVRNTAMCESFSQEIATTVSAYPAIPVILTDNYVEGSCQGEDPITLSVETPEENNLYKWMRNGVPINGASSNSYSEFLSEGDYSVEASRNGCGTTSQVLTIDYGEMPIKPEIIVKGPVVWYLVCSNDHATEYRWFKNEVRIEGADEFIYVAGSQQGRFEVAISDGSSCFARSDPMWIPLSTGIEQDLWENLKIYPNPTPGLFTLEMDNPIMGDLLIDIFSEQGSKILNIKFLKETSHFVAQIDLGAQPSGVYLIGLVLGKNTLNKRIVVE